MALAGTLFAAILLVLTAINAGPLWRDETNTANVAQMPTLRELWNSLPCESFPPMWPLLLRAGGTLGLAGGDIGIRLFGLYVGFFALGSFWLCARWLGSRAPILSIGLLGALPAFVFIVGANRAYGLACGLLLLTFGAVWRMVIMPSRGRILSAGIVCLLFAQCVYYDVVFLAAILAGGALVALRRRLWKVLTALIGIGALSACSLMPYLRIVFPSTSFASMIQNPNFSFSTIWYKLGDAVTARSSGEFGRNGPEVWLWIALLLGGIIAALLAQRVRPAASESNATPASNTPNRRDLALYCMTSAALGTAGFLVFLFWLRYFTQAWYYVELFCLCAIAFDGFLGATWPALRPCGLLRIGFMLALMAWTARPGWEEAHTRRTNVDLIAALLEKDASAQDFIVVQTAWEGITFNRYYHGAAPWVTVPPVNSHLVHRNDLVHEKINQPEPMAPILRDMTNALANGHNVWVLGNITNVRPAPPKLGEASEWLGTCLIYWTAQVSSTLLDHAVTGQVIKIPTGGPVCWLEDLQLSRFTGYQPGNPPTNAPAR